MKIGLFLGALVLMIILFFQPSPNPANTPISSVGGCVPYSGAPITVEGFAQSLERSDEGDIKSKKLTIDQNSKATYSLKLINVPVKTSYLNQDKIDRGGPDGRGLKLDFGEDSFRIINGVKYTILYPQRHGELRIPKAIQGSEGKIKMIDYGLVFLAYLNRDGTPKIIDGREIGNDGYYILTNVYQAPNFPPLPDVVIKACQTPGDKNKPSKDNDEDSKKDKTNDSTESASTKPELVFPSQEKSTTKEELQLEWFIIKRGKVTTAGGWDIHCKPAVYLYPKQTTLVNVKVFPKGELTLTIPPYPSQGWDVIAHPDGRIFVDGKQYPYLYYEAKIEDSSFKKPEKGFVVAFNELSDLYDKLLPKLGLNAKEAFEFKQYWEKTLPYSPYYFVGVMEKIDIDAIEPLIINPKPDSILRVHLYFEPLSNPKQIEEPELKTPARVGFVASEWGGLLKVDETSNFTCSN